MAVGLALASAAVFALGTVLQQREAMEDPDAKSGSVGVLLRLARRPVWLAGVTAYGVAFGLQAAALGVGRLVVVQPILATTIVFALPLGVRFSRQRVTRRDVVAASVVTVGLGLFLVLSDPGGGRDDAPISQWVVAGGAVTAAVVALTVGGLAREGALRAALLGTAAGLLFGLVSALTKGAIEVLQDDGFGVLANWHLYALSVAGLAGMTLTQLSLGTGALAPAVATSSIFNPALSVLLGLTLFDEAIHEDALVSAAAALALVAMFAGVAALAAGSRGGEGAQQPSGEGA
ncbi:MAG: DMT family transporter [Solirubrobacterales bacterium]